ncbi:MAG: glycerol-3-phosphate 1-O-acyltransferase PlsY [Cyanobacteria bacterium P01_H01_bin.15]
MNVIAVGVGLATLAYLMGALPTGYLVGIWFYGVDIREEGSGSTGATNVLRTLGRLPALFVLLIDCGKGFTAVWLSVYLWQTWSGGAPLVSNWIAAAAALCAVVGHSKSIWIGFKGGKSAAISLGVLFALNGLVALGTLGAFLMLLSVTRIVSVGSMTGAITSAALMIGLGQPLPYICFGIVAAIYVLFRHQSNIARLLAGTEPRIGQAHSVS